MFINVDHLDYFDFVTNSSVTMQVDENLDYQLSDGNPGATTIATETFDIVDASR
jgi:hypothetical protein